MKQHKRYIDISKKETEFRQEFKFGRTYKANIYICHYKSIVNFQLNCTFAKK
jgi:hypothetical protein